jgi:thioredoxin-related protein
MKKYVILTVDVDQNRELVRKYGVWTMPTFTIIDSDGSVLKTTSGFQTSEQFMEWIK